MAAASLALAAALTIVGLWPLARRDPPRLEPAFVSDEALARAVLDGLARRDAGRLIRIAVNQDEFEGIVWPTLPVSRPEVGMPMSFVWQDTLFKSKGYLAQMLEEFGGQRFELERVEFGAPTRDRGTYSISGETRLIVRDEAGGQHTLRLFGSIIRRHGQSKVYSYIAD